MACVAYFELVQPRFGEGPIEDSRPPRFANLVGLVVLSGASLAYLVGLTRLGAVLGLLAAITVFCAGCQIYRIGARLRGIRALRFDRIELSEVGSGSLPAGEIVVAFSHALCTDCRELIGSLRESGRPYVTVDVRERPDLARKYGIAVVPTAFAVAADGRVTSRLSG